MPLFLVRRTNPYAKPTDLDAAMFRGLICSKEFPGLKWLRTYHTDGMTSAWCVYEANSIDDVAEYSNRASLDYDEIVEIAELTHESYWTPRKSEMTDGVDTEERIPALAS